GFKPAAVEPQHHRAARAVDARRPHIHAQAILAHRTGVSEKTARLRALIAKLRSIENVAAAGGGNRGAEAAGASGTFAVTHALEHGKSVAGHAAHAPTGGIDRG